MFNYKIFQRPPNQKSPPAQVSDWITRQQNTTSLSIIISIENDHLIIRADVDNNLLLNLDWRTRKIIVTEVKSLSFLYEFREFKSAFAFLDALLLHYFIKTSATCLKIDALAALAA